MEILDWFFGFLAFLPIAAACVVSNMLGNAYRMKKAKPKTPVNAEKQCPHCGHMQHAFYTPATDPVPVLYKCYECKRYFGDSSKMTPEQKKLLRASDAECDRIDNMPEIFNILDRVADYYEDYFSGAIASRDTMIHIRGGEVRAGKYQVLARYDLPTTEIGVQHICYLCFEGMKQCFPDKRFILGEFFVDIDW